MLALARNGLTPAGARRRAGRRERRRAARPRASRSTPPRSTSEVLGYVVAVVRRTRELPSVSLGASPRAAVHLLGAAKAAARLAGREYVTPDDVARMAVPVLRHRLVLTPEAELERFTAGRRRAERARRRARAAVSPTPRAAALLAAVALAAFVLPPPIAFLAAGGVLAAVAADARTARRRPQIARELPSVLSRGVPVAPAGSRRRRAGRPVRVRQAVPPALALEPREGDGGLEAELRPAAARPARGARGGHPLGRAAAARRVVRARRAIRARSPCSRTCSPRAGSR